MIKNYNVFSTGLPGRRCVCLMICMMASVVLCLDAFAQQTDGRAPQSKIFSAGAAVSNITPKIGTSMNGHLQERTATAVHDELHARCIVMDDGKTKLAIVVTD